MSSGWQLRDRSWVRAFQHRQLRPELPEEHVRHVLERQEQYWTLRLRRMQPQYGDSVQHGWTTHSHIHLHHVSQTILDCLINENIVPHPKVATRIRSCSHPRDYSQLIPWLAPKQFARPLGKAQLGLSTATIIPPKVVETIVVTSTRCLPNDYFTCLCCSKKKEKKTGLTWVLQCSAGWETGMRKKKTMVELITARWSHFLDHVILVPRICYWSIQPTCSCFRNPFCPSPC